MILKKITLKNIRSYSHQLVEFPEGSTLLSGDIGSGKTSILLGIEFALFGLQPGQRGNSLLRNGEKEGSVVLEFEVDGKKVVVERILKRGKTITQDYCAITVDDEKREFAVTELKDKILEILSYPKEFAKKQNLLYKFTVYTPQEEMKQIITEDPETRVNTLRHVFGIDKYKKIIENTEILTTRLREEKRAKEAMIENLEQDRANLVTKEEELEAKRYNLVSVEKELFLKTDERKKIQEEKDAVSVKIEERRNLLQETEKTKIMIAHKKDTVFTNKNLIEQLESQVKEFSSVKVEESEIKNLEIGISLKKQEKEKLNEENLSITSQISSLKLKNQENDLIRANLGHLEICPTCLQDVDPVYKSNVINRLDSDTASNLNKTKDLTESKKAVIKSISEAEEVVTKKEKEIHALNILKIKIQGSEEKKKRLDDLSKTNTLLQKDIEILSQHLDTLNVSVFDLARFANVFEEKQKQLEDALKKERIADIKVAELKKEIEVFGRQIEELREKITRREEIREKVDHLTKIETWLSKNFIPLITSIEKNVMIKLKVEFSKLFASWFSMLVSDVFDVRLSDDFTPVIEYQDYDIDYSYLSGGERTAIALAYRLSLNQVINSMLSKIKTRELVILDEPTDGFSEQQLDKMRDVLKQLEVKQLIIVSHEQKIEGFVENVIRFKKDAGVSRIASENRI